MPTVRRPHVTTDGAAFVGAWMDVPRAPLQAEGPAEDGRRTLTGGGRTTPARSWPAWRLVVLGTTEGEVGEGARAKSPGFSRGILPDGVHGCTPMYRGYMSFQPLGCRSWRWWWAANKDAWMAANTTAMPQPRRLSWGVAYTSVPTVRVSAAAIAVWSLLRRPATHTVGGLWAGLATAADGAAASGTGEWRGVASGAMVS